MFTYESRDPVMLGSPFAADIDRDAKLTSEMTKAIRRQDPHLDYWRAGNSAGNPVPFTRPTYKNVTQINLNFPNGSCLPKMSNGQRHNVNKRENPPVILARSRTSLVPKVTVSSRSPGQQGNSATPSSKRAMVTDLTCLQLADSLFSSKKSPYAGLLDFWHGRSRYTDYFMDGKECNNNNNNNNNNNHDDVGSDTLSDSSTTKTNPVTSTLTRRGTSIPVLHYRTLPAEEEILQNNNNSDFRPTTPPEGHVLSSGTVWNYNSADNSYVKPKRSILKNGSHKPCSIKGVSNDLSTKRKIKSANVNCSYKLPAVNNEGKAVPNTDIIVTLDKIIPRFDSRPSSNKSEPRSKVNMDCALEGLVCEIPSRKRSVRFNTTHEIREYAPCEPVTYG